MKLICVFVAILTYLRSLTAKTNLGKICFYFSETERLTRKFHNYLNSYNQMKSKTTIIEVILICN